MLWKPLRGRSFVSSGKTRTVYLALVRNVALPLFSRFLPNPVSVDGFDLYFPDHGRVSAWGYMKGRHEPEIRDEISSELGSGDVFFDVGAHVGYFSVLATRSVGKSGRVHAFEAHPESASAIRKTIKANRLEDTLSVSHAAVTDHIGEVSLNVARFGSMAHSIVQDWSSGSIHVPGITLDHYWHQIGRPEVRLIKIDAEGAELAIVQGMSELVESSPDIAVIVEVNTTLLSSARSSNWNLLAAISDAGLGKMTRVPDGSGNKSFETMICRRKTG